MLQQKNYIEPSTFITTTIFLLLISGTLNATGSLLNNLGLLSLISILLLSNVYLFVQSLISKRINKYLFQFLVISILFTTISAIGFIGNTSSKGITNMFQFILCIGFFVFMSMIEWTDFKLKLLGNISSFFIILNFLYWAVKAFPSSFSSIYSNPNQLGPYMLFTMFFVILARRGSKNKFIYNISFVLGALVMFGSNSRAVFLAALIALLTFGLWNVIKKTRKRFLFFIVLVMAALIAFIFLYPKLPDWSHFNALQNVVWKYTGKNVMSGRSNVWLILSSIIRKKPWFGYGPGSIPVHFTSFNASSHNLYIQIALQNGYLGLTAFMLLISRIWMAFWKNKNSYTVRLSASFLIAILVHQSFEITLIQNQLSVGLMQWLIIAIGISKTVHVNRDNF